MRVFSDSLLLGSACEVRENTGTSDGLESAPAAKQLAKELSDQLRTGVRLSALMNCPAVLALDVVRAKAATGSERDRAVAARNLLRELSVLVDGQRNGATATLLGLATASRGILLKERRQLAADMLHISPDHLRTSRRERELVVALADELYAADSAYRRRHGHRLRPEQDSLTTRLGVDWLDRHQAYRRVWTPLNAIRNDIWVLLRFLRDEADRDDVIDRLMNIAWRWGQFQVELERFVADYGGLWLLADVESEYERRRHPARRVPRAIRRSRRFLDTPHPQRNQGRGTRSVQSAYEQRGAWS